MAKQPAYITKKDLLEFKKEMKAFILKQKGKAAPKDKVKKVKKK